MIEDNSHNSNDDLYITKEDYEEFINEKDFEKKVKILLLHSKKNNLRIQRRKKLERTQEEIQNEMLELNNEFSEFLKTKGIIAKFKLAFSNMSESTKKQHEKDVKDFNEAKAKSIEENKDFVEFLHTKGFKAKCRLVIENIKKGARESSAKTAEQIAKSRVRAQNQINANKPKNTYVEITAEDLSNQFNEFLRSKGLDSEYVVLVSEENK